MRNKFKDSSDNGNGYESPWIENTIDVVYLSWRTFQKPVLTPGYMSYTEFSNKLEFFTCTYSKNNSKLVRNLRQID